MNKNNKFKVLLVVIGGLVVCVVVGTIICVSKKSNKNENVTYRETTVQYGDLTVGITEDASVSIGTLTQSFDLDISALVSNSSSSSSSQSQSGNIMAMFTGGTGGGMSFQNQSGSYSSQSQNMEVESVNITVGQKINAGDVLYTLTAQSVDEIRNQLVEDIDETLVEYNSTLVSQQESRTKAKQQYDTYVLDGKLASVEYEYEILDLEDSVNEAKKKVSDIEDTINLNNNDLVRLTNELAAAQNDLKEAKYAVELAFEKRFENAYDYAVLKLSLADAEKIVEEITDEIDEKNEENEGLVADLAAANRSVNEALRKLESGKLSSSQTMQLSSYEALVSKEWYDLQIESLDATVNSIYKSYEDASDKLTKFDTYIVGNDVIAEYSGVVTEVSLSAGDNVTKNTTLVTMYDQDDVTMDVTISEDDYKSLDKNGSINISYDAYPDEIYQGVISEVSDATYDSSTGTVYYTITVNIKGNVEGLYEGMTGEVTFVTKETKEVTYVSNRAIFRDGTRSYVKMYDANGKVIEKDVVTGFSDGVNVEIVEGLSNQDVVLIESKVSES